MRTSVPSGYGMAANLSCVEYRGGVVQDGDTEEAAVQEGVRENPDYG